MKRLLVLALVAGLAGVAEADEALSPLRLDLSWEVEGEAVAGPARVGVGSSPVLKISVRNPTAAARGLQGPLQNRRGEWALGAGARLVVVGPAGSETVYRPALLECSPGKGFVLPAKGGKVVELWIGRYVPLVVAGKYTVKLRLLDAKNKALEATASFEVRAPKAVGDLRVRIVDCKLDARGYATAKVRFTNAGKRSLSVIKPQDGSTHRWVAPYYWFTVEDAGGRLLEPLGRCGNRGPPDYTPAGCLTLGPGKSVEQSIYVPYRIGGGRSVVTFHYILESRPTGKRAVTLPRDVFVGHARTAGVVVRGAGPAFRAWADEPVKVVVPRLLKALQGKLSAEDAREALLMLKRALRLKAVDATLQAAIREGLKNLRTGGFKDANGLDVEVLVLVADASCVPVFESLVFGPVQDYMGRHHAAEGLKTVAQAASVRRLIKELKGKHGKTAEPIASALQVVADVDLNGTQLPNNGGTRYPSSAADWDAARQRWLDWWAKTGKARFKN